MNLDRWIASRAARIAAGTCALLSAAAFAAANSADAGKPLFWLAGILLAVLTLLAVVFSFHGIYWRWMKFATLLQKIVIAILFGLCYLVIVPLFALLLRKADPLKLRKQDASAPSFWRARKPDDTDLDSYLRMG